jgi:putative redox protein
MKIVQSAGKSIKRITKAIKFENSLDESQVQRLLQIGSNCPISKLLEEPVEMEFEKL